MQHEFYTPGFSLGKEFIIKLSCYVKEKKIMLSVAPSTFLPLRGFPLFSNKGDLRKLSRYTPGIQREPATGVKSSLSPGRDLALKEVRINPERYTTDQLPAETDLLQLFVVGKKRIKRSMSKQQFVGFEPSPRPTPVCLMAQGPGRS